MRTIQHNDLLQAFAKEKARNILAHEIWDKNIAYLLLTFGYALLLIVIKTKSNVFLMIFVPVAFFSALYFSTRLPKNFDYHKEQIIARNDIFDLLVFKRKYTLKSIRELRSQIKAEIVPNSFKLSTMVNKLGKLGILSSIIFSAKDIILKYFSFKNSESIFSLLYIVSFIGFIVMALLFVYNVYNSFRGNNTYYEYILSILDSIIFDLEDAGEDTIPEKIRDEIQNKYKKELK